MAPAMAEIFIPPRMGESREVQQLREMLNLRGGQMMQSLDVALRLRTAQPEVAKQRHRARNAFTDFALQVMHAIALAENQPSEPEKEPRNARR